MTLSGTLGRTLLAAAALFTASGANAQVFRAYVSSAGNDANPCTLTQPCRLLPAALAAVADGGEIWMLDSANYNSAQVDITKSVTILAVPGALGSIVATGGGHGISINAAGVKVALRNLVIVHLTSSQYGVNFVQGAQLHISGCEISGMQQRGVFASAANSTVTIRDSVIRDNVLYGVSAGAGSSAALDRVQLRDNGSYGLFANGAHVTLSNSVVSGHSYGITAFGNASQNRVSIEGSVITGNTNGVYATASGASDFSEVTASRNVFSHNSQAAVQAIQGSGNVTVVVGANLVAENGVGFSGQGGATYYSRETNTMVFNTNDLSGVTLTSLSGQ